MYVSTYSKFPKGQWSEIQIKNTNGEAVFPGSAQEGREVRQKEVGGL